MLANYQCPYELLLRQCEEMTRERSNVRNNPFEKQTEESLILYKLWMLHIVMLRTHNGQK